MLSDTNLILNTDGSINHLNLLPGDIADLIFIVSNTETLNIFSSCFDTIELRREKGSFHTHTGYLSSKRISVISSGIGTNSIDILLNELDALANIDFEQRIERKEKSVLTIIRIGTSGSIHENIPLDSLVVSEYAIGLDTIAHYYSQSLSLEEEHFKRSVENYFYGLFNVAPYVAGADPELLGKIGKNVKVGITITCPGFYAPQGRMLRARGYNDNLIRIFQNFFYNNRYITNIDMETAGLYSLSKVLGHKAISVNIISHNRSNHQVTNNSDKLFSDTVNNFINILN